MTTATIHNDPTPELIRLSFEAGRTGTDWIDFTFREDVGEMLAQAEAANLFPERTEHMLAEFERGRLAHKLAQLPDGRGWIVLWTTAPADYDSFGAETVTREPGAWFGKDLRSVAVDPHRATYQADRWASGIHFVGEDDPRALQRQEDEKRERYKREDADRALRREAGLAYLKAIDDATLEATPDDGDPTYHVDHVMVREERAARSAARAEAARAAAWARDTATIPEGVTIVDEGRPDYRGYRGAWIPAIPTSVLYSVSYGNAHERDVEKAWVETHAFSQGRRIFGGRAHDLNELAEEIRKGDRFKIVDPSSVPPPPVLARFGHENLKKIKTAEIEGAKYYAHERSFSHPPAWDVLKADGKKVSEKTKIYRAVLSQLFDVKD